jgi:hypothetical protein
LVDRTQTGSLRRLYLLQDGRHGAQSIDLSVQTWLEENSVPYSIVYTKADQSSRPALVKWVNQACMRYHQQYTDMDRESGETSLAMGPVVHVISSKTGAGLAELWSAMEAEFATEQTMQSQSQSQSQSPGAVPSDFDSDDDHDNDHYGYDGDVESGDSDYDEQEHPYEAESGDDSGSDGEMGK